MTSDPAGVLRAAAADLEADAQQLDPTTPAEGGMQEGLGRAVGRLRERAQRLEEDNS